MQFEWNLEPLARSDDDAQLSKSREESAKAVQAFVEAWSGRDDYLRQPEVLAKALSDFESLMRKPGLNGREWFYFSLRSAQDQLDPTVQAGETRADELATKLNNQIQFFTLNLAKLPPEDQQKLLASDSLQPYRHFLERLFAEGIYTLTESEEKIINLMAAPAHDSWVRLTSSQIAKSGAEIKTGSGKKEYQTFPQLISLLSDTDKKIRDSAAIHVNRIVAENADVATAELNAIMARKKILDELRGYQRPDQARHLSDDIKTQTVDALISSVESRFDISQRYYKLKAALLGQPKLAYHERNVEYGKIEQHYPYDRSVAVVSEVFANLDSEFATIFEQLLDKGQIDVYPRQGKVGGAFCAHGLITQPTYVLLNHTDRLQDVLTLAHEMGHAINNEMMRAQQGPLTFDTPLSTAEVASTFMEDFVLQHIAAQADKPTRLAINIMKLNDDVSSIFRQVAGYQFERELHDAYRRENYLSKEAIGEIFAQHMERYMGPSVEQSPGSENWWVYWSHFRTFFYVYSYASGLLISKSLQAMVAADPAKIASVKQFLAAGTSDAPDVIFDRLGININDAKFWGQGLQKVDQLLTETQSLAADLELIPSP